MDRDEIWRHIHAERAALADQLATFSATEWAHASLCVGWTTKDVAAHVIASPQIGKRHLPAILARSLRGYNRMVLDDGRRRGRAPVDAILADFRNFEGSRRHPPVTTHVEPLIDVLVHTQDILRPLGRTHPMPVEAAVVAADRARILAPLTGTSRLLRSVRMVATDADWTRGKGRTIEGPMQELLLAVMGRGAHARELSGDGLELLG